MLRITDRIYIDEGELDFNYSRSGGPGGQNVNKLNTRVTVLFDIRKCGSLSESDKKKLFKKLSNRVNKDGIIRISSQKHRTQKANQKEAVEKLVSLLNKSLKRRPVRKKTKPPAWAKEKRLKLKKKRSLIKQQRTRKPDTF